MTQKSAKSTSAVDQDTLQLSFRLSWNMWMNQWEFFLLKHP